MDNALEWFALRVKPRAERLVAENLRGKGYERFLPMHRERRRWTDRVTTVESPLFTGYVFCRFDVQKRLPILTIPGVLHVVSVGRIPQPIDAEEMNSIRVLVGSGLPVQPWPYLEIGQSVRIVTGPLAGARGTLLSMKSQGRLVVSLTLLQRSVAVEVPEACTWPELAGAGLRA